MATRTFISVIQREGSSGSVRAKVPAGLVKAINADEGDAIEFQVRGTSLVGASLLTGKALRIALKERAAEAPTPRKTAPAKVKPQRVGKANGRATAAPVIKRKANPAPVVRKAAKPVRRKTEVEYEAPRVKRGGFTKALKKRA